VYLDAPAAVRLARRLKRDVVERQISVERNIVGWPNVLANEKAHILALRDHADLVINLVTEEELDRLVDAYAEILAAQRAGRGQNAGLTETFLRVIGASLDADFAGSPAPAPRAQGAAAAPLGGSRISWDGGALAPLPA